MTSRLNPTRSTSVTGPTDGVWAPSDLPHPFASSLSTIPPPLPGDIHRGPPSREFTLEVVRDVRQLAEQSREWRDLLRHSLESNVFFGPEILLSACEHLPSSGSPEFLLVRGTDRSAPTKPSAWCGLVPLVRRHRWRGVPMNVLSLHTHDYCFLRTPLVRGDAAREVLDLVVDWLRHQSGASLVEWPDLSGDGPFHWAWVEALTRAGLRPTLGSTRVRAMLRRASSADTFLQEHISGGKLKELRRLERRLREDQSHLSFKALSPHDDAHSAIERFLEVERSGWKGREGTAILSQPKHAQFFRQAATQLHQQGMLRLHWMEGASGTIAAKCNFLAGSAAYAFKIGFVESFARFSPGVQLEIDNIRRFHAESDLQFMDSCADPDHPMIDHLWKDRRSVHTWWVPLSRWALSATSLVPWAASFRKGLRGKTRPAGERS